ncbi:hypothetical protein BDR07DRAFT_1494646 [Suillus spraguei]|nr:hypothetical protein BDR07DRAFT_1494646 [Suillus spraguei]
MDWKISSTCMAQGSRKHPSLSTIWRTLHRTGYSRKKITREARERNLDKRAEYMYQIGLKYRPDQLIFVDKSSADIWLFWWNGRGRGLVFETLPDLKDLPPVYHWEL